VAESDRDLVQHFGATGHQIPAFITYFNATLAAPFKWTYTGRPLNV
jgi:hypothetical protein